MRKLLNKNNLRLFGLCVSVFLFSHIIHLNLAIPFALIILYISFNQKFLKIKRLKLSNLVLLFLVSFTFGVGGAILGESALSFIGLGISSPDISLGTILSDGKDVMDIAPWISFFAGLFIFLVTYCLVQISDYIQYKTSSRDTY